MTLRWGAAMRLLAVAIPAFFLVASGASAQWETAPPTQITRFDGNTVYRSIQCDIGRFAAVVKKQKIKLAPGLKAHISYVGITELGWKASFSAELGIKIAQILSGPGASISSESRRLQNDSLEDDFNVASENSGPWCKNRPPVYVTDCLLSKTDALLTGRAHCETQVTAQGKLSANGKFVIWYINVGPSFDYDVKRTYTITVDAPPKPGKKE